MQRLLMVLSLLLVLTAAAGASDGSEWVEPLLEGSHAERREAIAALRQLEEAALPALEQVLADERDEVSLARWEATRLLIHIGGPGAMELAMTALQDSAADVRAAAAWVLGRMDGAVIPGLIVALEDEHPRVRREAVVSLARRDDVTTDALPLLAAAVRDSDSDVREEASKALNNFRAMDESAVISGLIIARSDSSPFVSWHGTLGLRGLSDDELFAFSRQAIRHSAPQIRHNAALALDILGLTEPEDILLLAELLADTSSAATAAAAVLDADTLDLDVVEPEALVETLLPALESVPTAAAQAAILLGRFGAGTSFESQVLAELTALLEHEEPLVRRGAVLGLGGLGEAAGSAAEALRQRLDDPADMVQLAAVTSLGQIGSKAEIAKHDLIDMLSHPDWPLAEAAAESLRQIQTSRSALTNAFSDRLANSKYQPSTLRALRVLGLTLPELSPQLRNLATDPSYPLELRASAALTMQQITPAAPVELCPDVETARDHLSGDEYRLEAVFTFLNNVLTHGRDTYGTEHTPLFVDGVHVKTLDPVVWRYEGKEWIISNQASQQNLFRNLVALTELTGSNRYRAAAEEAFRYMVEHHRCSTGLLYWGGHQFIDLATNTNVGEFDADCHEFKNSFPFYEFMWEVDPEATEQFLKALWNAHILHWDVLDMNRHGQYDRPMGKLWDHEYSYPEPFYHGDGLTFINAGNDMILSGAMLYGFTGEEQALTWTMRLAELYVNARHPDTGLGVYQFSQPRQTRTTDDPTQTGSSYGDRAMRQFGPEFGDVALEGWMLRSVSSIYGINSLIHLQVADALTGEPADAFLEWTISGLKAFLEHMYRPEDNTYETMFADGSTLVGVPFPRPGYYGDEGFTYDYRTLPTSVMLAVARAYRMTADPELWEALQAMVRGFGLGELGASPADAPELAFDTDSTRAEALLTILELYQHTGQDDYLSLARVIGNNIVDARFNHGFFVRADRVYASFNSTEPLALLTLEAAIQGDIDRVPFYNASRGFIHGRYDGHGRTYDSRAIYGVTWDDYEAEQE